MSIDKMLLLPIENIIVPGWKVLEYDPLLTWLEIKTILLEIHEVTLVETFAWVIKTTQNYKHLIKPSALESFTLSSFRAESNLGIRRKFHGSSPWLWQWKPGSQTASPGLVGSTSVQQKWRNIHILFCLANAGIMAHTGHGLVNISGEWQGPNCLLGFTGSWETTGGGSSRLCSGKYRLSEAARQDLATHSRGKWRQAVCPALWMQKFWTHEQRNSLQTLDSSPEFRKLEFRYIHCEGYKVSHHSATKCSFCWRQLKTTLPVWVFPTCFFKQDSFKRP